MFGPPGHAYVYRSYGVHAMLNVVTEAAGIAAAVLIRAVEPCDGLPTMLARRALDADPAGMRSRNIANGPGRLCQALGIGLCLDGTDLTHPPLYLLPGRRDGLEIVQTTRIGITRSVEFPWRFYLLGNPAVSVRHRAAEASQFPAQARSSRSKAGPSLHSRP
jgi:DNA-3-methyladenine glycosylase